MQNKIDLSLLEAYHRLLQRQLRRASDDDGVVDLSRFVEMVNESYQHSDEERRKVENSMLLMSEEMLALNEKVRLEANSAIREAHKRFELAVSGTMDGIWDINLETHDVYYSPIWYKILGFEEGGLPPLEDSWFDRVHEDDRKELRSKIGRFLESQSEENTFIYRILRQDGVFIWAESKWAAAYTKDKKPYRLVGTMSDVTKRKETEEMHKEAREAAERSTRLKSDFLATMSHEIRTPMNGVLGILGLLEETPLTPQQKELCSIIKSSGSLLLNIINDILDFSKLESGNFTVENFNCDIEAVIQNVVRSLGVKAAEKGIKLTYEIDANVPHEIRSDPVRIEQILFNLTGNAVKFTQKGFIKILVHADQKNPYNLSFDVVDTGIGIKEDTKQSLFKMFFQADSSTARVYGGTGLGLAITKKLVSLLDGTITCESEYGKGSTFSFTIVGMPPEKEVKTEISAAQEDEAKRPLYILVAEDNTVNQFLIRKLIEKMGYRVDVAGNGEEAIELLQKNKFYDLILMDIHMPIVDGKEATIRIRALESDLKTIPIIPLTANVLDTDKAFYASIGMNGHLSKPIDEPVLKATILEWSHAYHPKVSPPPQS